MELILVLVIALVVLGPKRLPEAGKALGKGLREFKDSVSGLADHHDEEHHEDREPSALPADRSATPAEPSALPADRSATPR